MGLSATAVIEVNTAQADPAIGPMALPAELEPLIEAVSIQIDEYLDKPVIQRQYVEERLLGRRRHGRPWAGDSRVKLDHSPVVSVASIVDQSTPTAQSMTENEDYYLHKGYGTIESLHLRGFPEPVGFWTITYTAGLAANRAAVDHRIRRAAIKLLVAHRSHPDPSVVSEKIGNLQLQYQRAQGSAGELVVAELPADVRVLLDPMRSLGA